MTKAILSERTKRILRETTAPYLADKKREALAEFMARLETEHGDNIRRVILFGSHARGDAEEESDVDLLIVTRAGLDAARQVKQWCKQNSANWVSEVIYSEEMYEQDQRLRMPFYVSIRRDGIELWNPEAQRIEEQQIPLNFIEGEFRMLDYETIETIRVYLRYMKEDLDEAHVLAQANHPGGAVAKLYYAAFDITIAALYSVNVVRGKHSGVRDAVNEFLVKPGLLETDFGEIYKNLMEGRLNVDYRPAKTIKGEKILTDAELRQLLHDGERYIERMKKFLIERGLSKSDLQ